MFNQSTLKMLIQYQYHLKGYYSTIKKKWCVFSFILMFITRTDVLSGHLSSAIGIFKCNSAMEFHLNNYTPGSCLGVGSVHCATMLF